MSDDAKRTDAPPSHGRVGPSDPTADPVTDPGMRQVAPPGEDQPTEPAAARRSRTGGLWVGLILSAVVLLLLLVFILQNPTPAQISFFAFEGVLPLGVALLLASIAGMLLVAIPGSLRILQLRRVARRRASRGG
jgi:uncharacterized integral membrane protein